MDCSLLDSVHGILQARKLVWVAIPFSRGSSRPRDWTWVSREAHFSSCIINCHSCLKWQIHYHQFPWSGVWIKFKPSSLLRDWRGCKSEGLTWAKISLRLWMFFQVHVFIGWIHFLPPVEHRSGPSFKGLTLSGRPTWEKSLFWLKPPIRDLNYICKVFSPLPFTTT